eukprot:SAG31_NODE_108_length_24741_cov_6.933041_13_plen_79_part_00
MVVLRHGAIQIVLILIGSRSLLTIDSDWKNDFFCDGRRSDRGMPTTVVCAMCVLPPVPTEQSTIESCRPRIYIGEDHY